MMRIRQHVVYRLILLSARVASLQVYRVKFPWLFLCSEVVSVHFEYRPLYWSEGV